MDVRWLVIGELFILLMPTLKVRSQSQDKLDIQESLFISFHKEDQESAHVERIGRIDFSDITYRDTLMNYISALDTVSEDRYGYQVNAIFGNDTLLCNISKPWHLSRDIRGGKKVNLVVVESKIPPYATFEAVVEGMNEEQITQVIDTLYQQKSKYRWLMDASQTCISYALECLFQTHGIHAAPICSRRTMYPDMEQGESFLKTFCNEEASYEAKIKKLAEARLPDKSLLAFRTKGGEWIHAVFYMNHRFYSKNGISAYVVYKDMKLLLDRYGRWGKATHVKGMDPEKWKASFITVYTLNQDKFKRIR